MTEDDQMVVGIQFLMRPRRHIAHRHRHRAVDVGSGHLPRLTNIDETSLFIVKKGRRVGGGNLEVEHKKSLKPAPVGQSHCIAQNSALAAPKRADIEWIA